MRPFGCLSPERFTVADVETSEGFNCEEVFGHGYYQKGLALFAIITMWVMNSHTLAAWLISADVDHWCRQPDDVNLSSNAWKNLAIPIEGDGRHSRCTVYASPGDLNDTKVVECDSWQYDPERAKSSIVPEWNLVCSRSLLKALATSVPFACSVVFLVLSGYGADRFGRLPVIQSCAVVVMATTLGSCFANSYPVYVISRFLVSCSTASLNIATITTAAESCSFVSRPTFLTFSAMMGLMLADTCLAVLKQVANLNWFLLQLIMVAPTLLLPAGFFLVAESPRWLIACRRLEAAQRVMMAAAKSNGFHYNHVALLSQRVQQRLEAEESVKSASTMATNMAKVTRRRGVIMFGSTFSVMIAFYVSLQYKVERRAATPWIQWAPLCANALAFCLLLKIVNRMDKTRLLTSIYFILGSIFCSASIVMLVAGGESSSELVSEVVFLMARGACKVALIFDFIYVIELFPTPTRGVALCLSFAAGRLGGMVAALFSALAESGHDDLLFLLISATVFCSAYSFAYLPREYGTFACLADADVRPSPAPNVDPKIEALKQTLKSPRPKRKQSTLKRSASSIGKRSNFAYPAP